MPKRTFAKQYCGCLTRTSRSSVATLFEGGGNLWRYFAANADGRLLFMVTGTPVIDRSGLDGEYLFVLTYRPLNSTENDPSEGSSGIFSEN